MVTAWTFGWSGDGYSATANSLLTLRYAQDMGATKTLNVYVDGVLKGTLSLVDGNGWGSMGNDYRFASLNLGAISAGANSVKFVPTADRNTESPDIHRRNCINLPKFKELKPTDSFNSLSIISASRF